jgi:hypothetical protein
MGLLRRRPRPPREAQQRFEAAWAAYDAGRYEEGVGLLEDALRLAPSSSWWFDLGLMHKWRQQWPACLAANLEAARLDPDNAPAYWNGGIAATALSDWPTARRLWRSYGVCLPDGEGEPVVPIGRTPVRVGDPELGQEVVWCTRLDPARARVENVPTPECDRRWGDVVLHDGEPKGERWDGAGWAPVFDEISLWRRTTTPRLRARVRAGGPADVEALADVFGEAGWAAEDWTSSVQQLCRACSEGRPDPTHDHPPMDDWQDDRPVGLACPESEVVALLDRWRDGGAARDWSDLERVD